MLLFFRALAMYPNNTFIKNLIEMSYSEKLLKWSYLDHLLYRRKYKSWTGNKFVLVQTFYQIQKHLTHISIFCTSSVYLYMLQCFKLSNLQQLSWLNHYRYSIPVLMESLYVIWRYLSLHLKQNHQKSYLTVPLPH